MILLVFSKSSVPPLVRIGASTIACSDFVALWMRGTDPFALRYCILLGLLFIIESDSIHIIALTCVRSQIKHEVSMCS